MRKTTNNVFYIYLTTDIYFSLNFYNGNLKIKILQLYTYCICLP